MIRAPRARPRSDGGAAIPVTIVLVPQFPLHALALCVDTLRVANREALRTAFSWTLASEHGDVVTSSSGIDVSAELAIDTIEFSPVTILLAAYEPQQACTERLLAWLKRQDRRGGSIGCVDTGALILARAGLARRGELSVHQAALSGAREDYRAGDFTAALFAFGERRFSSAGGIATIDMMLALIEHHEDSALAERVAQAMNHTRRESRDAAPRGAAYPVANPVLARCVDLMHAHIEDPLSLAELSACAGVPAWTLRRLFRRHLGTTPQAFYRQLRLQRGRELLAYSHLSVAEVAAAVGFAEVASFSHAFARRFGVRPSRARHDESGLPA